MRSEPFKTPSELVAETHRTIGACYDTRIHSAFKMPPVVNKSRSGLLRFAALEIRDHFIDRGNFVLEPLLRFFECLDPLFAGVKMPAAPGATACEAGEDFKTF